MRVRQSGPRWLLRGSIVIGVLVGMFFLPPRFDALFFMVLAGLSIVSIAALNLVVVVGIGIIPFFFGVDRFNEIEMLLQRMYVLFVIVIVVSLVYSFHAVDRFISWRERCASALYQYVRSVTYWLLHHIVLFCQRQRLYLSIAFILFFIPFFWFSNGEGDFGGDSSRLYFYDPWAWLQSVGFSEINSSPFGSPNANYALIPFVLLLTGIKWMFFGSHTLLLSFFNGVLLALSFTSMYAVVLAYVKPTETNASSSRSAAFIAALFFTFSQIIMYNWPRAPFSFSQIAVYPWMFWFFLRYIQTTRLRYVVGALLLTILFSLNFSFFTTPVFSAFFVFSLPFLTWYSIMQHRLLLFTRSCILFVFCFLLLNAFHLMPQIAAFVEPGNLAYRDIFTAQGRTHRGLNYFESVRPKVRLLYNLVGFHQYTLYKEVTPNSPILTPLYTYGVRWIGFFLLFFFVCCVPFLLQRTRRQTQELGVLALTFILTLFFITANMFGSFGPAFYRWLFSVPGFAMFRSFYGVFSTVFIFFYALLLGYALHVIFSQLRQRYVRWVVSTILGLMLVLNAIPFITGRIFHVEMMDTRGVKSSFAFKPEFEALMNQITREHDDGGVLVLPFANFNYHILEGRYGGAYVGPSPIAILGGRQVYSGLEGIERGGSPIFNRDFFFQLVKSGDDATLKRFFSLLNVRNIFFTNNPHVYRDVFIGWPFSREVWEAFPTFESFSGLISRLEYEHMATEGEYTWYKNERDILSTLYIPEIVVRKTERTELDKALLDARDLPVRTAFVAADMMTSTLFESIPSAIDPSTTLKVERVNRARYRVYVTGIQSSFPLILSQAFHSGWKLYPTHSTKSLDEQFHFTVNDYANAWLIEPKVLMQEFPESVQRDENGYMRIAVDVVFSPRQYFLIGIAVSSITALLLVCGWVLLWRRSRPLL